jgi:Cytochrome oxidase complex assembly protein 1
MSVPPPLPQTVVPHPGWWERHWRWAVPVICVIGFALLAGVVFAMISFIGSAMRDSEPYRVAMREARGNAEVVRALGQPIEAGWMMSGSFNSVGTREEAQLSISIEGPKGEGTIYVEGSARNGAWIYDVLLVKVNGRDAVVDLLSGLPQAQRRVAEDDTAESAPEAPAMEDEPAQDSATQETEATR